MEYIATHDIQNFLYSISIKYNIENSEYHELQYIPFARALTNIKLT